ncbi:MAG: DUF1624 domain-containing protein [Bacilli bacterium]|nr:DUF1624 domain-containing protein [Bacilli bacterium]
MKLLEKEKLQFDKRIHEIDLFRGFLIILVIFDHLMWFINFYICHHSSIFLNWYWTSTLRYAIRQIVLMMFLFTCGISCYLSRNNKRRGFLLFLLCIGITIVTHIGQLLPMFSNRIIAVDFNVLGVISLSIFLFAFFEKENDKNLLLITAGLMLFYFFILLSSRLSTNTAYLPFRSIFYCEFNPVKEGYVGDYLPLFPYIIFLFLGVLFARKFYKNKVSLINKKGKWEKPICFLGRHTLIIYIAHEVIFTLIFMLIDLIF